MAKAFIGLGANLGDREANIRKALEMIGRTRAGRVKRVSTLIETEPVGGPPGQEMYLNGAALVETYLSPCELLDALKRIECAVGRIARERWAAREVDLDILLYGDEVVKSNILEIPHPRLCERHFVLRPLAEIAPDAVHPITGMTVAEHLAAVKEESRRA